MRVLGVTLDRRITFDDPASAVAISTRVRSSTSTDAGLSTDAHTKPDSLENRLLTTNDY